MPTPINCHFSAEPEIMLVCYINYRYYSLVFSASILIYHCKNLILIMNIENMIVKMNIDLND